MESLAQEAWVGAWGGDLNDNQAPLAPTLEVLQGGSLSPVTAWLGPDPQMALGKRYRILESSPLF